MFVEPRLQLGVHDFLTAVQRIPPADQEAEGAGQGEKQQSVPAEQLDGQEDGGQGAVYHSAEQGDHRDGRPKGRVQSEKRPRGTAESGADE